MRTLLSRTTLAITLAISASATAATKIAFVTSVTGNGNLSSWPAANGQTGLAAGDQICRTLAANANPPLPGNPDPQAFVAWLSDNNNDAYCRMFGLTGKKAANCGQAQLPTGAGPWMRVDGEPFADKIEAVVNLNDIRIFSTIAVDENNMVVAPSKTFTHTAATGVLYPINGNTGTCSNWSVTNNLLKVMAGDSIRTSLSWTAAGTIPCKDSARLICMQIGTGDPLPNKAQWGKRGAFLSAATGNGDLASWAGVPMGVSGIDAGDAVCRKEAQDAGFYQPNSYKAYLSTQTAISINAIGRFVNDGPWIRPDGLLFADGKTSLQTSTLRRPLNVTTAGIFPSGFFSVWTGTSAMGTLLPNNHCTNWLDSTNVSTGRIGQANIMDSNWADNSNQTCNNIQNRLYCLSDADVIFWNKFRTTELVISSTAYINM